MRSKKMKGGKMVLTVNEAMQMNCPAQSDGELAVKCTGDDCPAWRWWDEKGEISWVLPDPPPGVDDDDLKLFDWINTQKPEGEGWVLSSEDWAWVLPLKKERRGYCGLAGKPDYE